ASWWSAGRSSRSRSSARARTARPFSAADPAHGCCRTLEDVASGWVAERILEDRPALRELLRRERARRGPARAADVDRGLPQLVDGLILHRDLDPRGLDAT